MYDRSNQKLFKIMVKSYKKLRVLGICAGQGALLFPWRNQLLGNIEPRSVFHTPNEEQWKLNFGETPFLRKELPEKWRPDIILSSPDCGASSTMRLSKAKELGNPEKNESIKLVLEGIIMYQPKIFMIENVPRLMNLVPESFWESVFPNYKLLFKVNSVSDFGNSQVSRKRLIIIGIKKHAKSYLNLFDVIFSVNTPKCSRFLLEQPNRQRNIPLDKTLAMYDYRKLPKKKNLTVKEIQHLWTHDFKNEKKWPIKTARMSTLPGVYRLDPDKPPLTLRPADRQFRPDGLPLGVHDYKNIQGFPDKFKIYLPEENYLYWLNKSRYTIAKGAVYEVGIWFKRCIKQLENSSKS